MPLIILKTNSFMKKNIYLLFALLILGTSFNNSYASVIVPVTSSEPDPAVVKNATNAFNSLSKKEKKARIKEVKKEIKAYKAEKKAGSEPSTNTLLLVILAILLPPLAVYLYEGEINSHFWICLILTLLGFLPGIIYALVIILGKK
jgi:uncharacterized membrane protein YqaE (UPF0057 family)